MGHSLSADKRERQNVKRRRRNRENMGTLRKEMKRISAEVEKTTDAKKTLSEGFATLDKAARKNTIPKKRADRKKSRLALALNRAKAASAAKK
jgi:small subunit ribosomal protein S20